MYDMDIFLQRFHIKYIIYQTNGKYIAILIPKSHIFIRPFRFKDFPKAKRA